MFVKVSTNGRPAKLHLEGTDLVLDPKDGQKTKIEPTDAMVLIDTAFEVQKAKALEILQSPAGSSLYLVQPAFKDVSMEMERLASAKDEVELRIRASKVRLAPVQQTPVVEIAPRQTNREPIYQRDMRKEEQPLVAAKTSSNKKKSAGIMI